MTIRNPIEWSVDNVRLTAQTATAALRPIVDDASAAPPAVRRIDIADLGEVLNKGWRDFTANRTDVVFLCLLYPLAGIIAAKFAINQNLLPLLFPFVSGFALVGPFAASGLYAMSRQRERGQPVSWSDAFSVLEAPSLVAIVELALLMTGLFLLWLAAAMGLYHLCFGAQMPTSLGAFIGDVVTTRAGWTLMLLGCGVGFLFALLTLAVSVVSFPLLLDRPVSIATAVRTSIQAARVNPGPLMVWGAIVAVSLVAGAIPALLGLIVVMPVLGHATWHLYRKVVV